MRGGGGFCGVFACDFFVRGPGTADSALASFLPNHATPLGGVICIICTNNIRRDLLSSSRDLSHIEGKELCQ